MESTLVSYRAPCTEPSIFRGERVSRSFSEATASMVQAWRLPSDAAVSKVGVLTVLVPRGFRSVPSACIRDLTGQLFSESN